MTEPASFGFVKAVVIFSADCRPRLTSFFGLDRQGDELMSPLTQGSWDMDRVWVITPRSIQDSDEAPGDWPEAQGTRDCENNPAPSAPPGI